MKKLMTLAFVMTAALSFGCKKDEAAPPAEKKVEEVKPVEAPKPVEEVKPAEPAAAGTGLPECDAYLATVEAYSKCDKIPAEARDATAKSLEATKASWASLSDPAVTPEAKKAAADACKTSDEALKTAWTAAGCQ